MMYEPVSWEDKDFIPPSVACFGKRYVKKWQASTKNLQTYRYWRQLFFTAAISRFEWVNLPQGMDSRYLELLLYGWGAVAATRRGDTEVAPYWMGRMSPTSNRDLYNNPNALDIIAPNGYRQRRHANYWVKRTGSNQYTRKAVVMPPDAVICWDNLTREPIMQIVELQAQRLAAMDMTVDQHSRALRVPYIIGVEEGGEKNAEEMYNRIDSGQPAIYTFPQGTINVPTQILQTMGKNNYAGSDLLNDELKIVSNVYTMLGIDNNAAAEKKERVQTSETLANNEQFMVQRYSFLKPRKDFCDAINEMYGWGCDVRWAVPHVTESGDERGDVYVGQ